MDFSFTHIPKRLRCDTCIIICLSLLRTIQPIHCPERQHISKLMLSTIAHLHRQSQKLISTNPHLTRQPCRLPSTRIKVAALDAGLKLSQEFLQNVFCDCITLYHYLQSSEYLALIIISKDNCVYIYIYIYGHPAPLG